MMQGCSKFRHRTTIIKVIFTVQKTNSAASIPYETPFRTICGRRFYIVDKKIDFGRSISKGVSLYIVKQTK
jgi:hypothetical protein